MSMTTGANPDADGWRGEAGFVPARHRDRQGRESVDD